MALPADKQSSPDQGDPYIQFRQLFDKYYRPLTVFALGYVTDLNTARDIVQMVFLKLWESRKQLIIKHSSKAYLYQCVKNACYNHTKAKKSDPVQIESTMMVVEDDVLDNMIAAETRERIYRAIDSLPKKCRVIFKLSRIRQLKHAEIAKKLGLSEKTVENQISIALKKLANFRFLFLLLL